MFISRFLRSTLAVLGLSAASMAPLEFINPMPAIPQRSQRGARRRRKSGWFYPHSSARQQARYARQIAAGQLSMDGIERSAAHG